MTSWQGKECSDKARDMFLELGDKEGLQIVDEVRNSAQDVLIFTVLRGPTMESSLESNLSSAI